ncbi:MAG TPA: hypothetical protein PKW95_23275 [bacterium]|nr:hypothetical protein [bacterium]
MKKSSVSDLLPGIVVRGSVFPEPVEVIVASPFGDSIKLVGRGVPSNQVINRILTASRFSKLKIAPKQEPFDGDSKHIHLGYVLYPVRRSRRTAAPPAADRVIFELPHKEELEKCSNFFL